MPPKPTGMLSVLRRPEFGFLWLAVLIDVVGSELAAVALSLLVYARTGSASLTALTYASTFVPQLLGGTVLAALADRWPRRRLLVGSALTQAGLIAVLPAPGLPLAVMILLVAVVTAVGSLVNAGRTSYTATLFAADPDAHAAATSANHTAFTAGQLLGLPLGGAVVLAVGSTPALWIDAGSFLLAAALTALALRGLAAPAPPARESRPSWRGDIAAGGRYVWTQHAVRQVFLLSAVGAVVSVVPEAVAVPLAHAAGGSTGTAGVLMAAVPAGLTVGLLMATRLLRFRTRMRLFYPLALAGPALLLLFVARWPVWAAVAVLVGYGMTVVYVADGQTWAMRLTAPEFQGRVAGWGGALMTGGQGAALLLAGLAADAFGPARAIAACAAAGLLAALLLGRRAGRAAPVDDAAQTPGIVAAPPQPA